MFEDGADWLDIGGESTKPGSDPVSVEEELNRVIPSMTKKDAPIVKSVSKSIKAVLNRDPDYVASPGSYDQKHIDRIGTLKNCIAYGP